MFSQIPNFNSRSMSPYTRAAVDKVAYPNNKCGKELVFDIKTPEKYHSNQINLAHAHKYKNKI